MSLEVPGSFELGDISDILVKRAELDLELFGKGFSICEADFLSFLGFVTDYLVCKDGSSAGLHLHKNPVNSDLIVWESTQLKLEV